MDEKYFLIYDNKQPEVYPRKKELNEMINVTVEGGMPRNDI